jgi:hypothetical protein
MTRPLLFVVAALLLTTSGCRREHPAIARAAAASTATAVAVAALPTVTPTPLVPATAKPAAGGRRAKIAGGQGIATGIQMWSRPGGVMASGATMVGTVPDGSSVEILAEEQFIGQRYFQVRGPGVEGWIEARFVQLEAG